ncbi:MAG: NAD+ synthase, partial [Euryarchaeota archaeon]|nr:NAD+ synthase [Euryarchaeota archaeon]
MFSSLSPREQGTCTRATFMVSRLKSHSPHILLLEVDRGMWECIRTTMEISSAMRPQLKEHTDLIIKDFIRQKVEESGGNGVVIGLSGGIDSAVVSKLSADAIGANRVLNIFMPSGISSSQDRKDAEEFSSRFGMEFKLVDITPALEGFQRMLPRLERKELVGNLMTRCRMIVLFHEANLRGRVVMGTSNKSELLIGYFTKFGDGGADFCPIGDLYKSEVRELARRIGIPKNIIEKVPTAGLWADQTDESEMGISYENLDSILMGIEMSLSLEEIAARTGLDTALVERVWNKHRATVHKRKMPLIPKTGVRTLGLVW